MNNVTKSDGNIYYIYPNYMITGYAGNETIDFSNLDAQIDLLEDDKLYLGECNPSILLSNILLYSGNRYINEDQGTLHFSEDDFQSLLKLIKLQQTIQVEDVEANTMFCKGDTDAIQAEILNPYWYFYYEKLFGENFQLTTPGYDGAVIWELSSTLGIISSTENKEGTYAFFDYLFSPPVYHDNFSYDGFPILKSFWEHWENKLLSTEPFIDSCGFYNIPKDRTLGFAEGQYTIKVGSISSEDVERMRSITENAIYQKTMSYTYINIILEEVAPYLIDQRSLEDTCDIIEHRIQTAISE